MNLLPLIPPPTCAIPVVIVVAFHYYYYLALDGPADQVVGAPVSCLAQLLDPVQVIHARRHGHAPPCLAEFVVVQQASLVLPF